MEDGGDFRRSGSFKSTLSGKSTPRNSPTFRRLHSVRTPRREGRSGGASGFQWFRSNRLVYWLLLITLWTYLGFYVQSRWAHGDNKDDIFGYRSETSDDVSENGHSPRRDLSANQSSFVVDHIVSVNHTGGDDKTKVFVNKTGNDNVPSRKNPPSKRGKRSKRNSRRKASGRQKAAGSVERGNMDVVEDGVPNHNSSYRFLFGPFGSVEDRILEWSPEKRSGTCDRKGQFSRLVWSRKFVLIFHELSMTGAPLSMMELASELLSCGATVTAVALSKRGGLMPELARRKINVLEDKGDISYKIAMKADLIIAGSAVCASWIDQYFSRSTGGSSQVAWWIMENRREYFDRAKLLLNRVKMLIFLSASQSAQWLSWCKEENIKLLFQPGLVPLSVNDELAFVAGFNSSLNTPSFSTENMMERRKLLRDAVRNEMGLTDKDMLVISLSSINPGKGQLMLLESARFLIEKVPSNDYLEIKDKLEIGQDLPSADTEKHSRALLQNVNHIKSSPTGFSLYNDPSSHLSAGERKVLRVMNHRKRRKVLRDDKRTPEQVLRLLIGSVGSKSNKMPYLKGILKFISRHSNLSDAVMWTTATTRVASLYSAADVYVMNSQGLGETFGRVTIEAMAFGLPVLGTDAGGTKEIVEHNVTGLLHPPGRQGIEVLSRHLDFLLKNPSEREKMGKKGREKVKRMYLKRHTYESLAEALYKCMKFK